MLCSTFPTEQSKYPLAIAKSAVNRSSASIGKAAAQVKRKSPLMLVGSTKVGVHRVWS